MVSFVTSNRYSESKKFEIVFTEGLLDAGLCVERDRYGSPKKVMARASQYNPEPYYGGVEHLKWVSSGVLVTKYDWIRGTNQSMSARDVADKFGIRIDRLSSGRKPAQSQSELREEYTSRMFEEIQHMLLDELKGNGSVTSEYCDGYAEGVNRTLAVFKSLVQQAQKGKYGE